MARLPIFVLACLGMLALAPAAVYASAPQLPAGFMPFTRSPVTAPRAAPTQVAILTPEGPALPAGFMPLARGAVRPLTPSKNPKIIGSIHQIKKKDEANERYREISSDKQRDALSLVHASEAEVTLPVDMPELVHRTVAVRHAWPLPKTVTQTLTSNYGIRRDPFTDEHRFHDGIDIAAPTGSDVLASADGVIEEVATGKDYGRYVRLRHRDGSHTIYGHLSKQLAEIGQQVRQGQKLGEVGSTGRSTGPHLHFEIERDGHAVNPIASLSLPRGVGVASR